MDPELTQAAETTPLGTPPVPAGGEAPVSAPADESGDGSLSSHEAAHGDAPPAEGDEDARNERGQFKPRRRAQSQRADADDVPTINELTRRIKSFEDEHGKDIVRKEGESDRVYTLRRRAELAERLVAPKQAPAPVQQAQAAYQPPSQVTQQPLPQNFPEYEDFLAIPGNEEVSFNQYLRVQAQWTYAVMREQERQQEAADKAQQALTERLTAHAQRAQAGPTKYPDWDAVVMPGRTPEQGGLPITFVLRDAIIASDKSDDITYHLGKNRDILAQLNAESQHYSPSAVAAMRRYLDTLVAPATSSPPSTRPAAGSTGAALTLAPPPAPKPPTPVRTGAVTSADDPPGDDNESLSAHEKFFGQKRRA